MENFLQELKSKVKVALVGGSDLVKIAEQMGGDDGKINSDLQKRVCIWKLFFLLLNQTYVVGTQKKRLNETVLLSTQNIWLNR